MCNSNPIKRVTRSVAKRVGLAKKAPAPAAVRAVTKKQPEVRSVPPNKTPQATPPTPAPAPEPPPVIAGEAATSPRQSVGGDQDRRRRRRNSRTILTSTDGVLGGASTDKKTLLGG